MNDYARKLTFRYDRTRTRRDHEEIPDADWMIAFLHQVPAALETGRGAAILHRSHAR